MEPLHIGPVGQEILTILFAAEAGTVTEKELVRHFLPASRTFARIGLISLVIYNLVTQKVGAVTLTEKGEGLRGRIPPGPFCGLSLEVSLTE